MAIVSVNFTDKDMVDISITINTYGEVKKRMNNFMMDSADQYIRIYRQRKGQWGEWFEHWAKVDGRNVIVKQGWQ